MPDRYLPTASRISTNMESKPACDTQTPHVTPSLKPWKFRNPVAVRFGYGCIAQAAAEFSWRKMLLVTSPGMLRRGTVDAVMKAWPGVEWEVCAEVEPNPQLDALDQLAAKLREHAVEGIVGLGGGSAVDSAKILGVLLAAGSDFSLHRHFREGQPLPPVKPVPVVAIPTTSGTGSEVTPFATVWDLLAARKYSLSGESLFPHAAFLAPELTYGLPWEVTLSTGLDALCQAMESVWNRHSSPITLELARRGAREAWEVLRQGTAVLDSPALRERLMEASLLAGLAISQTRTALCHSISYPVTARFGVPHGVACGFVLPAVLRFNAGADDGRLQELARDLGFASTATLADGLETWLREMGIPALLTRHGVTPGKLIPLVPEMITPGRADNNLRKAEGDDIAGILANYLPAFLQGRLAKADENISLKR